MNCIEFYLFLYFYSSLNGVEFAEYQRINCILQINF